MRTLMVSIFLVVGSLVIVQAAANFLQNWQARRQLDYQASLPPLNAEPEPVTDPFLRRAVAHAADTQPCGKPAQQAQRPGNWDNIPNLSGEPRRLMRLPAVEQAAAR